MPAKKFRSSITPALALLPLILAFSLASCVNHFTLTSPTELPRLPVSRGINRGSYVAPTAWAYRGTRAEAHEFGYFYHTHNQLHHCRVTIPRDRAVLHFPEVPFDSKPEWRSVTLESNRSKFHFFIFRPPPLRFKHPFSLEYRITSPASAITKKSSAPLRPE
jgi:hypothetical protein